MARPDLSTPEGLTAYRAELRGVAQPVRMAAFALVLIGAAVVVAGVWMDVPAWAINGGYTAPGGRGSRSGAPIRFPGRRARSATASA